MKTPIVGVTGLARSGKDTAAKFLAEAGYTRIAFADPLKEIVANLACEPVSNFHDDILKEQFCPALGTTRRDALQKVGMAMRQLFGDDVWLTRLRTKAAQGTALVVSDVRYENEAKAIRDLGGIVLKLERPGAGLIGDAARHASEQGFSEDLVDCWISNNGSIDEFKHAVQTVCKAFNGQVA